MTDLLDKSLDEMIASRPKGKRRGSKPGGAANGNTTRTRARYSGNLPAAKSVEARQNAAAVSIVAAAGTPSEKIIVSNLPIDVNEAQIKELFQTTVGPLKDVNLHFDHKGTSKGVATVQFQKKGDGARAFQQYNNRLIDGKRPMKIEIVMGPPPPRSLASRVAPAPKGAAMEGVESTGPTRTKKGTRGRRPKKGERPQKSAADLDAEMEDYSAAPKAAAAVSAA